MRIVINHLTRMRGGRICVCGINPETRQHVRPDRPPGLGANLLECNGGPFDIGNIVALEGRFLADPPHIEDFDYRPQTLRRIGAMDPDDYWTLLESVAQERLTDIFGRELEKERWKCSCAPGTGKCSSGVFIPPARLKLSIDKEFDKLKLTLCIHDAFPDNDPPHVYAPVTDLRLFKQDLVTPDEEMVARFQGNIIFGGGVLLSVGLSRAYDPSKKGTPRHWMQVNNFHFRNRPGWKHIEKFLPGAKG